jgi:sucrose phosphorylase
MQDNNKNSSNGVMLNAYPDSIGNKFSDIVDMLKWQSFKDVFSLLYSCLPFNRSR